MLRIRANKALRARAGTVSDRGGGKNNAVARANVTRVIPKHELGMLCRGCSGCSDGGERWHGELQAGRGPAHPRHVDGSARNGQRRALSPCDGVSAKGMQGCEERLSRIQAARERCAYELKQKARSAFRTPS